MGYVYLVKVRGAKETATVFVPHRKKSQTTRQVLRVACKALNPVLVKEGKHVRLKRARVKFDDGCYALLTPMMLAATHKTFPTMTTFMVQAFKTKSKPLD